MKGLLFKNFWLSCFGVLLLTSGAVSAATHLVKKGETFYSLSRKYGVSTSAIMKVNGISDKGLLIAGSRIKIPAKNVKKDVKVSLKSSRKTPSAPVYRPSRKSLSIVVDAGHGGRDRGASYQGAHESALNLKVAKYLESDLKKKGYNVRMTRRSDSYVSLGRRAQIANGYRNAIFVSIHFNASEYRSVHGTETFYVGSKSGYLARSIQSELVKKLKMKNRGAVYRRYSVLSNTNCPAVLVECGFISNARERSRCRTYSFQKSAASAICAGIEKYDRRY